MAAFATPDAEPVSVEHRVDRRGELSVRRQLGERLADEVGQPRFDPLPRFTADTVQFPLQFRELAPQPISRVGPAGGGRVGGIQGRRGGFVETGKFAGRGLAERGTPNAKDHMPRGATAWADGKTACLSVSMSLYKMYIGSSSIHDERETFR